MCESMATIYKAFDILLDYTMHDMFFKLPLIYYIINVAYNIKYETPSLSVLWLSKSTSAPAESTML